MGVRRSYGGLDYFRMIAAVLVVCIHYSPLSSSDVARDFFITMVVARMAVEVFFLGEGTLLLRRSSVL